MIKEKILKETKYCKLYSQVEVIDEEYTQCVERIYVKQKKREEIRFSLYKDTVLGDNRYVPRALDVTEIQLVELISKAIKSKVLSAEFMQMLKEELKKK